jgi:uncharacterized tellurite resistance protein B-like protein
VLKSLQRWLESRGANDDAAVDDHAIRLASTALLIELTRADHRMEPSETEALRAMLRERLHFGDAEVEELLAQGARSIESSTGLHQFTRLINDRLSYADKCRLLTDLWTVARADGRVDGNEEHLIRKVQGLLHIAHSDFIRSKQLSRQDS